MAWMNESLLTDKHTAAKSINTPLIKGPCAGHADSVDDVFHLHFIQAANYMFSSPRPASNPLTSPPAGPVKTLDLGRMQSSCSFIKQYYLEVGEELLWLAVMLSLHDDIGQLVNDDIEGSLGSQWLREVNLTETKTLLHSRCSGSIELQHHTSFHIAYLWECL